MKAILLLLILLALPIRGRGERLLYVYMPLDSIRAIKEGDTIYREEEAKAYLEDGNLVIKIIDRYFDDMVSGYEERLYDRYDSLVFHIVRRTMEVEDSIETEAWLRSLEIVWGYGDNREAIGILIKHPIVHPRRWCHVSERPETYMWFSKERMIREGFRPFNADSTAWYKEIRSE
jgi:hypothetical protein